MINFILDNLYISSIDYLNILQIDDQWIRIFILRILLIIFI